MGYSAAMKRRITVADVQAALDGFVRGGLVRIAATETPVDAESISGAAFSQVPGEAAVRRKGDALAGRTESAHQINHRGVLPAFRARRDDRLHRRRRKQVPAP